MWRATIVAHTSAPRLYYGSLDRVGGIARILMAKGLSVNATTIYKNSRLVVAPDSVEHHVLASEHVMKCQECEKPATFHITELTDGEVVAVHMCEDCAKDYLAKAPKEEQPPLSLAGALAQQMKVHQTADDLAKLDQSTCPICGITFYEFRKVGRLGCPHDYVVFQDEMEPLIVNIHGAVEHTGKTPKRSGLSSEMQTELIRLRREMATAIEKEDYEKASELRDQIRQIEGGPS